MSILPRQTSCLTKHVSRTCWNVAQRLSTKQPELKKTCLHDFHVEQGGKMVEFAGWSMPVQYKDLSLAASHLHTRSNASIFDVSHMLQSKIQGRHSVNLMEAITVADVAGLNKNQGSLTLFTNESGGILDDLIVTKLDDDALYVVSNAGCAEQDHLLMKNAVEKMKSEGLDVSLETINNGLIALQGPKMAKVLQNGVNFDLSKLTFMTSTEGEVFGVPGCRISRCGYTGEDGVEISIPLEKTQKVVEALMGYEEVKMAGLGARDSLRLEAGLCLYGSDIDQNTTPIEGTLAWTIAKRRRKEGGFPGADIILNQLKNKPSRKRVGIISKGAPARGGVEVYDASGEQKLGSLTSGCPSPSLKVNVAMGYLQSSHAKSGTAVKLLVRNKFVDGTVSKMPFVPAQYYTGK